MNRFRLVGAALAIALCSAVTTARTAGAIEPGAAAPDFSAPDTTGKDFKLSEYKGKVVVLEWFNYGCPFVKKHYNSKAMQSLQKEYTGKGVEWVTINSTAKSHRDFKDAAETQALMKELDAAPSAVIVDADGKIGQLYAAKTTPHIFIIDQSGKLVYQGAIDDAPEVDAEPSKASNYARSTLDAVLSAAPVPLAQTKPYGCSVKYES